MRDRRRFGARDVCPWRNGLLLPNRGLAAAHSKRMRGPHEARDSIEIIWQFQLYKSLPKADMAVSSRMTPKGTSDLGALWERQELSTQFCRLSSLSSICRNGGLLCCLGSILLVPWRCV